MIEIALRNSKTHRIPGVDVEKINKETIISTLKNVFTQISRD